MLQDKYDSALTIIAEHNSALGVTAEHKPEGSIDPEKFISCIKVAGGTSEDRLAKFSWDDILGCMKVDGDVQPKKIAQEIADVWRGKHEKKSDQSGHAPRPVTAKKAERMTPNELVAAFDPEDYTNPVGKRLSDISRGEAFIVFSSGRIVDTQTTTTLLLELKSGFPEGRKTIKVGNDIKQVYKLGQLPEHYVDENPVYEGRPLRPDGTCDQTNRSWEGVSTDIRQFIRVGILLHVFKVNMDKAHELLDMALKTDAFTYMRDRHQDVAVEFDKLKKEGNLPTLQVELGSPVGDGEGQQPDPFSEDDAKKVVWQSPPKHSGATLSGYVARRKNW